MQSKANRVTDRVDNSAKRVAMNRRAASRLLAAVGASGNRSHAGPGRPKGTYKYGVPIQRFKQIQQQKKNMAQLQAYNLQSELTKKGYTPEQIQQIIAQKQATSQMSEDEYNKMVAESVVSPHTQAMLEEIKRIQGKSKADDANMQRILRERKMVNQQMNLMNTPNIFKSDPNRLNEWLERPETNPLRAQNIFAERPDTPHITQTHRLNLLQTREAGNSLNFFGDPLRQDNKSKPSARLSFWK